jgi:phage tail-like protein
VEYTRQLIDFFPDRVRDRIDRDEDTAIAHFANAIQPALDRAIDAIENEPDLYDPDICPIEHLDWLGQLVGLARSGTDYLGLGLNPNWSNQQKRSVISRAWQYWQIKGTRLGVTEAISIWLDWNPSRDGELEISKPFGESPVHTPPQWAGWNQPYRQELIHSYREIRRWGGGDIPGENYLTDYNYLPPSGFQLTIDGVEVTGDPGAVSTIVKDINTGIAIRYQNLTEAILDSSRRQLVRSKGSANSSNRPWMHFGLEREAWNRVAPDIARLNPEIWSARTDAVPFTWLKLTPVTPIQLPAPTTVGSFCNKSNWRLTIITGADAYSIEPIVSYLLNPDGSGKFKRTQTRETQYLEFLFDPVRVDRIHRIELSYAGLIVLDAVQNPTLAIDPAIQFGAIVKIAADTTLDLPTVGVVLTLPKVSIQLDTPPPYKILATSSDDPVVTDKGYEILILDPP